MTTTGTGTAAPHGQLVPALEIGGAHVSAARVDLKDTRAPVVDVVDRADLVATESAEQIVERIVNCAKGVAAPAGSTWGVAVPGPFDYARGVALFKDVGKFDALWGVDLRARLLEALPSQAAGIVFLNDAAAFLRGEWMAGAARGHDCAVGLTLGTGIGSAFLAAGRMVAEGPLVPPEGSVHLLTVRGSPLEQAVSSRAITGRYAEASGEYHVSVREVAERARAGEAAARRVLDDAFWVLGEALAPWLSRFRPSVVVVGGAITQSWDLVAAPLRAGIRATADATPEISVVPAEQPELAPLIGAAWHAAGPPAGPRTADARRHRGLDDG